MSALSHRCHSDWWVGASALNHPIEGVGKHKAKLARVAVHGINLGPPVQMRLQVKTVKTSKHDIQYFKCSTITAVMTPQMTYIGDYSVQRINEDKVKGRR